MKNLYYRSEFRRTNILKIIFVSIFATFWSYARLLLEVFIKHNFGERYFKLSSAITVAGIVGVLPVVFTRFAHKWALVNAQADAFAMNEFDTMSANPPMAVSFWPQYFTWYLFLAAFLVMSFRHHREQQQLPGVLQFKRFSLSSGELYMFMFRLPIFDKSTNQRVTECYLEPAAFFIAGCLLALLEQNLGWLLIFCSICYSTSYMAAYSSGDDFVMDRIDEIICNEELENSFVSEASSEETRGFTFRGRRPDSHEFRYKIMPLMLDDSETLVAE